MGLATAAFCAIAAAAGAAGCSKKSTAAKTFGGSLFIEALNLGASGAAIGNADFYSEYTPAAGEDPFATLADLLPVDVCQPNAATGTGGTATFTSLDAGPSIDLTSGAFTLTLDRDSTSPPDITYSGFRQATPVFDADYDIAFAGGGDVTAQTWTGALRMPKAIVLTAPPVTTGSTGAIVTFGGTGTVSWTPTGSDGVILSVSDSGGNGPGITCFLADDGSFEIPVASLAVAPSNGDFVFASFAQREHSLNGRSVEIVGVSAFFGAYTKP